MSKDQKITLRRISTKEEYFEYFYRHDTLADWNPSKSDAELFLAQGKGEHFYVGFVNEIPFCSFLFVDYPAQNLLFFGSYFTVKEFRGKGLTLPLFQEVYGKLKVLGRNLIFTASDFMLANYVKMLEVQIFGKVQFLELAKEKYQRQNFALNSLKSGKNIDINKLIEYDFKACGYDRSISVRKFVEMEELISIVFEDEQGIRGYGVVLTAAKGPLMTPLIADSPQIAHLIIEKAFELIKDSESLSIDCPEVPINTENLLFLKKLGFATDSSITIVGQSSFPNNWKFIYGCYSVAIGI